MQTWKQAEKQKRRESRQMKRLEKNGVAPPEPVVGLSTLDIPEMSAPAPLAAPLPVPLVAAMPPGEKPKPRLNLPEDVQVMMDKALVEKRLAEEKETVNLRLPDPLELQMNVQREKLKMVQDQRAKREGQMAMFRIRRPSDVQSDIIDAAMQGELELERADVAPLRPVLAPISQADAYANAQAQDNRLRERQIVPPKPQTRMPTFEETSAGIHSDTFRMEMSRRARLAVANENKQKLNALIRRAQEVV